jgi:hypothetical protein
MIMQVNPLWTITNRKLIISKKHFKYTKRYKKNNLMNIVNFNKYFSYDHFMFYKNNAYSSKRISYCNEEYNRISIPFVGKNNILRENGRDM